ncbi:unnamed protein product [Citrullus colocynthis]|uniref:Uncharacterized protein n=1 Tax=Citrullus colocynthis TaxID=252529 RepID=A0ABP0YWB9_9ROSI
MNICGRKLRTNQTNRHCLKLLLLSLSKALVRNIVGEVVARCSPFKVVFAADCCRLSEPLPLFEVAQSRLCLPSPNKTPCCGRPKSIGAVTQNFSMVSLIVLD